MIQFDKYANQYLKATKLEDTRFGGEHPNGINTGYVGEGILNLDLSNGHQCLFLINNGRYFHTSQVEKIEEFEGYDLVYTKNSIYKVEPQFTSIPGVQEKHSIRLEDSK